MGFVYTNSADDAKWAKVRHIRFFQVLTIAQPRFGHRIARRISVYERTDHSRGHADFAENPEEFANGRACGPPQVLVYTIPRTQP